MFLVYICDNFDLLFNVYCLILMGVSVVEVEIYFDCELVINFGQVFGSFNGIVGKDLVFGLEVVWIEFGQCDQVQLLGYIVVDVSIVVVIYLNQVLYKYVYELLGYEEV